MNATVRKWIVSLKRNPQKIPLTLLVLCCMTYTFNLTVHSNASMYVSSQIIAFYVFVITLCSILTIFSFTNVYAKRQKNKKLLMLVVYLLAGIQIVLDILYIQILNFETVVRENPVPVTADIASSGNWTIIHLVLLIITVLAILLLPVYHKLLLKINTTVQDEELGDIDDDEAIINSAGEEIG